MSRRINHHTTLEYRGGAARVAAMLDDVLRARGFDSARSFEIAETETGGASLKEHSWEERLRAAGRDGALLHLHSSQDWPKALEAALGAKAPKTAITLHDVSLFTGGCPYPLDCPNFAKDCQDPCPRKYPNSQARRALQRALLTKLQPQFISPSRWLAARARQALGDAAVHVIPNGVSWPESLPKKEDARAQFGIAPTAKVALFAAHGGVEAVYKAGDHWLGVWEILSGLIPDAVACVAGGKEHRRDGDVLYFPYLEQETLQMLMRSADVFLYPTLADNHPLLVLEAMAAGCATLSFAVGGVVEQITPKVTGMLAKPGDMKSFVNLAAMLLNDPKEARSLGRAARLEGKRRFSRESMADAYAALYESC